jgi:hypothetical protein
VGEAWEMPSFTKGGFDETARCERRHNYRFREFAFCTRRPQNYINVSIRELDFHAGGGGAYVWPTSVALSIFLLSHFGSEDSVTESKELLAGKDVLELGSGVGLSGSEWILTAPH